MQLARTIVDLVADVSADCNLRTISRECRVEARQVRHRLAFDYVMAELHPYGVLDVETIYTTAARGVVQQSSEGNGRAIGGERHAHTTWGGHSLTNYLRPELHPLGAAQSVDAKPTDKLASAIVTGSSDTKRGTVGGKCHPLAAKVTSCFTTHRLGKLRP